MISILVVVHAVCGKGEEEAWLRGAHIVTSSVHIHVHTYMMYVLLRYMYIHMHTQHMVQLQVGPARCRWGQLGAGGAS